MFSLQQLLGSGSFALMARDGVVYAFTGKVVELQTLEDLDSLRKSSGKDIVFVNPYRSIREKGYEAIGDEPILALVAENEAHYSAPEAQRELQSPSVPKLPALQPSLSDEDFAKVVAGLKQNEISGGNAAQVIYSRIFSAKAPVIERGGLLAIFRELLQGKGQYMTVCFFNADSPDGSHFVVASPERHLQVTHEHAIMNPIAGTLPKGDPRDFVDRLVHFILDEKEKNELFQVVDEEIKMMAKICPRGGRIEGPFLREVGAVIHTEYVLRGLRATSSIEALRHSLHAPTLCGGPIESAARIIARYEEQSRRYYGGEIGVLRANDTLDCAIMIRAAEFLKSGEIRLQAGAGIVRDSDPLHEARETSAKAGGLMQVLQGKPDDSPNLLTPIVNGLVGPLLQMRNTNLSHFLFSTQIPEARPNLVGKRVLIVDNEDNFSSVLAHFITHMGCEVKLTKAQAVEPGSKDFDLVVLGPGPGDPNDPVHENMVCLRKLCVDLQRFKRPLLGVCLGHQVLAITLGLPVIRQAGSTQGVQKTITFFDNLRYQVGCYNSFSPVEIEGKEHQEQLLLDSDNRIMGLKKPGAIGLQFHPESVMSEKGYDLLAYCLQELLGPGAAKTN